MKEATDELVRISAQGEAHPIGPVASQRMRAREGTYRVLPAPPHVIFMRYTGEDGRRDPEDGAVVRLSGEITAPGAVCDVLAMLVHARWRGELCVANDDQRRSIFMENGNVVGATTTASEERLGSVVLQYGALDEAQVARVMDERVEGERFGDAAQRLGLLTSEQLYAYMGRRIEGIVFGAMAVDDGTFFFLDGFDGDLLVSHHTLSANMLLMDGVTRIDEMKYFRQRIPDPAYVPAHSGLSADHEGDQKTVVDAIDGVRSVAEIGRVTGLGEFETTKALYALLQSGEVQLHPPRLDGGPEAVVVAANQALEHIHRVVDEGGEGEALRQMLSQFALGGGEYMMLFRSAGPDELGRLDAETVCENVAGQPEGEEARYLMGLFHEYISFALFAAGHVRNAETEAALAHDVADVLAKLQPQG